MIIKNTKAREIVAIILLLVSGAIATLGGDMLAIAWIIALCACYLILE